MSLADLKNILQGIAGFSGKVAYYAWPENEAPALPFIVFNETGSDNMAADNRVYYPRRNIDIELYTALRSESTEAAVENAMQAADLVWEKTIDHLDSERCFMITYTVTI